MKEACARCKYLKHWNGSHVCMNANITMRGWTDFIAKKGYKEDVFNDCRSFESNILLNEKVKML